MTNLEHYEKELKENGRDEYPCTMFTIREDLSDEEDEQEICDHKCQECFIKSIKWFGQQYHEPVLTREEKVYLKTVITPIEKDSLRICKVSGKVPYIRMIRRVDDYTLYNVLEMNLNNLNFKFESMEEGNYYTLEDLGL